MAQLQTYLAFNGNCREAMTFYNEAIGGELKIMTMGESPMGDQVPPEAKNNVMHATVIKDDFLMMAADSMSDNPVNFGSSISLSVACKSEDEVNHLFEKLSVGGTITMPLQDTFWGARFGMIIDKFGIPWMFNFEKGSH